MSPITIRNLAVTAAVFAMTTGVALAQDAETTTTSRSSSSTTTERSASSVHKPGESYEWSVDTTTTRVPVHPTVTEKTTTTTVQPVAPPPPTVIERSTTTTTTNQ